MKWFQIGYIGGDSLPWHLAEARERYDVRTIPGGYEIWDVVSDKQ